MTPEEFDIQFDVLFNNISSNQSVGLNAYEKSMFLTKAQDEILKNYFVSQNNKTQAGYDDNQKRQIDFSMLTNVYKVTGSDSFSNGVFDEDIETKSVQFPSDVMFLINETVKVKRNSKDVILIVNPIRYDEYTRLKSKPYKRPLKNQAWRLITGSDNTVDLIVGYKDTIIGYDVRYVKKPLPIIIGSLDGLTLSGYCFTGDESISQDAKGTAGCQLDSILHEEILQRAVELAKIAWASVGPEGLEVFTQAGQRSE